MDNSSNPLKVEIIVDGKVVETGTTTAGYGVVTVSHSFIEEKTEDTADEICSTCAIVFIIGIIILVGVGMIVFKKVKSKKKENIKSPTSLAPQPPQGQLPQQPSQSQLPLPPLQEQFSKQSLQSQLSPPPFQREYSQPPLQVQLPPPPPPFQE